MVQTLKLLFILLILFPGRSFSQDTTVIRKGLLSVHGTIAPAFMLVSNTGTINNYLHGNAEFYTDRDFSIAGDIFYFVGAQSGSSPLRANHSNFFGGNFHSSMKNSDMFFGFQPGIGYSAVQKNVAGEMILQRSVNPLVSVNTGLRIFVSKFFHFFLEVRYVHGKHITSAAAVSLDEIKLSGGLGLNLNVLK